VKVKLHSIRFGYREAVAKIDKDEKGRIILVVDGVGPISALEYIKQGLKLVEASDGEVSILRSAGYPMRNEMI